MIETDGTKLEKMVNYFTQASDIGTPELWIRFNSQQIAARWLKKNEVEEIPEEQKEDMEKKREMLVEGEKLLS